MALGKGLNSLIPQGKGAFTVKQAAPGASADKIWHIPLSEIIPNTEQPRKEFSHQELEDLVLSIKEHGVMQPITVTERPDGGYELIAGERRWRASQIAGNATVPALVRTATQKERLELALIENIQRQNLNAIEEGFAYARLMEQFGLTQEEVAQKVGKSRPAVANTIRLLDLPEEIKTALIKGHISAGKARALLSIADPKVQMETYRSMAGEQMSVRDVEERVSSLPVSHKGMLRRDPAVLTAEKKLEERYGVRVRITQRGDRGSVQFLCTSRDELKRLMDGLLG
jgi:ParB family transcriptional regulator, chromosome partitioning protein